MNAKTKLDVWNIDYIDSDKWEEVPDEDLFQDGELNPENVMYIIYHRVVKLGTWKLIRRKNER